MTEPTSKPPLLSAALGSAFALWLLLSPMQQAAHAQAARPDRQGDYIIAVVNQELVTAAELELRMAAARASNRGAPTPPPAEFRRQVLDSLIEERVLVTHARNSGVKIEESEINRAVANVAQQNQVSLEQLRERIQAEGMSYERFRNNVKDQLLVERVREREVLGRVRISDADVEDWLAKKRGELRTQTTFDVAHILVRVPDGAAGAVLAERRARAEQALSRLNAGEAFEAVAKEYSDDSASRENGGRLGTRTADRLPDLFVAAIQPLQVGQRTSELLQSPAGFHILKLVGRSDTTGFAVTQTRARHILLRTSPQLSREAAARRLNDFKRQVESGRSTFEALAKANSEDGSAPNGGDLGWASPGTFVPEFEQVRKSLPLNGLSDPVVSRFGVQLIQVMERRNQALDAKQQRELARNALREQKFEEAYDEWLNELRARAYIEMREASQ